MAFFDATLFTVVPRLYRALDAALDAPAGARPAPASDTGRTGTRPPRVPAFLRLGQLDRRRPRRQPGRDRRDHRADAAHPGRPRPARLRGGRDPADADRRGRGDGAGRRRRGRSRSRLARDAEDLPETDRQLRRRFPDEPYRQRFGFIAERLRRTRVALTGEAAPLTGRYEDRRPSSTRSWPRSRTRSSPTGWRGSPGARSPSCAGRSATFGFHLASLEIRQHARSIAAALAGDPATGAPGTTGGGRARRDRSTRSLATFRAIAAVQARFGDEACHRYVVSFTASAGDVTDVLELAGSPRDAGGDGDAQPPPVLDVVPLFESSDALERGRPDPRRAARRPGVPRHLRGARRPPGGDARLLRFEQGIGLPRRPPGCSTRRRRRSSRSPASTASS